jgi:hypothetical protein
MNKKSVIDAAKESRAEKGACDQEHEKGICFRRKLVFFQDDNGTEFRTGWGEESKNLNIL